MSYLRLSGRTSLPSSLLEGGEEDCCGSALSSAPASASATPRVSTHPLISQSRWEGGGGGGRSSAGATSLSPEKFCHEESEERMLADMELRRQERQRRRTWQGAEEEQEQEHNDNELAEPSSIPPPSLTLTYKEADAEAVPHIDSPSCKQAEAEAEAEAETEVEAGIDSAHSIPEPSQLQAMEESAQSSAEEESSSLVGMELDSQTAGWTDAEAEEEEEEAAGPETGEQLQSMEEEARVEQTDEVEAEAETPAAVDDTPTEEVPAPAEADLPSSSLPLSAPAPAPTPAPTLFTPSGSLNLSALMTSSDVSSLRAALVQMVAEQQRLQQEATKLTLEKNAAIKEAQEADRKRKEAEEAQAQTTLLTTPLSPIPSSAVPPSHLHPLSPSTMHQVIASPTRHFVVRGAKRTVASAAASIPPPSLIPTFNTAAASSSSSSTPSTSLSSSTRTLLKRRVLQPLSTAHRSTKREIQGLLDGFANDLNEGCKLILGSLVAHESSMGNGLMQRYKAERKLRKQLHDQLIEMNGNIRVFARVRPLMGNMASNASGGEKQAQLQSASGNGSSSSSLLSSPNDAGRVVAELELDATRYIDDCTLGHSGRTFEFDQVLHPQADQAQVWTHVQPFVQSVVDGFAVTILAYGQTGSGKTYTMEGTPSNPGVNYRALHHLFNLLNSRPRDEYTYSVRLSSVEIYNETPRDLLLDPKEYKKGVAAQGSTGEPTKLEIHQNGDGSIHVPGLTQKAVNNVEEIQTYIENFIKLNRATSATSMNEHSSRSHSIMFLHVESTHMEEGGVPGDKTQGRLVLVDLAGSERVKKSEAQGQALKEATHINKSLSALGDVISALKGKNAHIPYRNSKLTYLLSDCLGGNSKVLLFAQISPSESDAPESLCTLQFASRARSVQLGAAKANKKKGLTVPLVKFTKSEAALKEKESELAAHMAELKTMKEEMAAERGKLNKDLVELRAKMQQMEATMRVKDREVEQLRSQAEMMQARAAAAATVAPAASPTFSRSVRLTFEDDGIDAAEEEVAAAAASALQSEEPMLLMEDIDMDAENQEQPKPAKRLSGQKRKEAPEKEKGDKENGASTANDPSTSTTAPTSKSKASLPLSLSTASLPLSKKPRHQWNTMPHASASATPRKSVLGQSTSTLFNVHSSSNAAATLLAKSNTTSAATSGTKAKTSTAPSSGFGSSLPSQRTPSRSSVVRSRMAQNHTWNGKMLSSSTTASTATSTNALLSPLTSPQRTRPMHVPASSSAAQRKGTKQQQKEMEQESAEGEVDEEEGADYESSPIPSAGKTVRFGGSQTKFISPPPVPSSLSSLSGASSLHAASLHLDSQALRVKSRSMGGNVGGAGRAPTLGSLLQGGAKRQAIKPSTQVAWNKY